MTKTAPCRAQAARLIAQLMGQQSSLANLIPKFLPSIVDADQGLFKELCFGVMRHHAKLSAIADQLIQKPLKEKDWDVYALLLVGLYQLGYMRTPDHAAIAETVQASVALRKQWAKSFINGVLRQYQRRAESLTANLAPAASQSHPEWLYGMIKKRWREQFETILAANNAQPPMILRVNRRRCDRDDYLKLLLAAGIEAHACRDSRDGIVLAQGQGVEQLPHFSEGWASVQDESAQLAASLLDVQPQHRVLDACCAPGGKTCHILELNPEASVQGLELVEGKLERVRDNLQRLGLQAELLAGDASRPQDWHDGQLYDRILLDAPCSATGVIRRNPDVKLMRQPEEIREIAELQLSIITALWPLLAVGGKLVYATCSIMPAENTQLIERFMATTNDAKHLPIDARWGIEQPFGRQLLPGEQDGDGFFYACIEKRKG